MQERADRSVAVERLTPRSCSCRAHSLDGGPHFAPAP
jgi:hypothetical protein